MGETRPLKIGSIWALISSVVVLAVAGIFVLIFPRMPFEEEVLVTSLLVAGYSVLGLAAAVAINNGRLRGVLWSALGLLGLSLLIWLVLIWVDLSWRVEQNALRGGGTLTLAGGALLHAGLVAQMRLTSIRADTMRWGSVACSSVVAIAIIAMLWEIADDEEWYVRGIGVFVILAALGTLLMLAFARLDRIARENLDDTPIGARVDVAIECPRCGAGQHVRSGTEARCGSCRLRIKVEVEEPRCRCGYLLLGLASEVCPECGRAIDENDRWAADGWRDAP